MLFRHGLRILAVIVICFVCAHLYTSSNYHIDDLQTLLDQSVISKVDLAPQGGRNRKQTPGNSVLPGHEPPENLHEYPKPKNLKLKDYSLFFDGLESYSILGELIKGKYTTEKAKELFSTTDDFLFSKEYLENVLDIPQDVFESMKDSHHRYVFKHIPSLLRSKGVVTFGNLVRSDEAWSEYEGSSGYVLVGGGKYSWLSYLVIKQIRATGAQLPIELFIASEDEYEEKFCTHIAQEYNAQCNVFDKALAQSLLDRFKIGGYQYKMLALLSSKFENVLYMDSDNFPTKNMDYIFDSELYKQKQMILWPDAWARTTNPKFYDIAEHPVKQNKLRYSKYDIKQAGGEDNLEPLSKYTFANSWFHDFEGALPDPTSETGMFIINKTNHLRTLLLALYYNVFGPDFYYPILTQGSAGEGDKETFIAAATVMDEPWHQTKKQFLWTGYNSAATNKFESKALAHFDPVQSNMEPQPEKVDIVFMHLSYPKFFPDWLVDNHDLVYADSGEHIRMYEAINTNVGYDFDLRVLQLFTESICPNYYGEDGLAIDGETKLEMRKEYMGNYLSYIQADEEKNRERCEKVFIPHLKWLKGSTKTFI